MKLIKQLKKTVNLQISLCYFAHPKKEECVKTILLSCEKKAKSHCFPWLG